MTAIVGIPHRLLLKPTNFGALSASVFIRNGEGENAQLRMTIYYRQNSLK